MYGFSQDSQLLQFLFVQAWMRGFRDLWQLGGAERREAEAAPPAPRQAKKAEKKLRLWAARFRPVAKLLRLHLRAG